MQQLSRRTVILYHLYPGVLTTLGFVVAAPIAVSAGFPPMFGMLVVIALVTVPVFFLHLRSIAREGGATNWQNINGLKSKLPTHRLILYSLGLVVLAFLIWGLTQPITEIIDKLVSPYLPDWYRVRSFAGLEKNKVIITLIANLILNGIVAPFIEEIYFRGYLLPRMTTFGKFSFVVSAVLFSLYHFWQPQIYLTLILALLPMTYAVYRTQDLRLAILTHCLLNIVGAVLTFFMP